MEYFLSTSAIVRSRALSELVGIELAIASGWNLRAQEKRTTKQKRGILIAEETRIPNIGGERLCLFVKPFHPQQELGSRSLKLFWKPLQFQRYLNPLPLAYWKIF
ncbi:hypothetical protein ACJMK2_037437 [Sinanodonta woodiana]|uniref:Uncharacterized protein n=1 Tax=Sinanodonta woodiana TaxID=1069815 RepID=A0ABD3WKC8_SINWO